MIRLGLLHMRFFLGLLNVTNSEIRFPTEKEREGGKWCFY